jgi:hypothetical protein
MKNKYVIIEMTNGEGYSEPIISTFLNEEDAHKYYCESIGMLLLQDMKVVKSEPDHFVCEDSDDESETSYCIYYLQLDYYQWYILELKPDILDFNNIKTSIPCLQKFILNEAYDFTDKTSYNPLSQIISFDSHCDNFGYIYLQIV